MAKKTPPVKTAAKKVAASSKKPSPAIASKPQTRPAVKAAAKPAPKPAVKPPARPASKPSPAPAVRAVSKPVAQPVVKPDPAVVAPPAPQPAPVPAPLPAVSAPPPLSSLPKTVPLTVNVQTSQGMAANGNTQPANLLVIVTSGGWPVTELDKNHFTLMEFFEVPGQTAPFSNSITTFRNAGTGAYLIQTKPINGAPWKTGHHLGQLLVSNSEDQQGQAAFKIIIR